MAKHLYQSANCHKAQFLLFTVEQKMANLVSNLLCYLFANLLKNQQFLLHFAVSKTIKNGSKIGHIFTRVI